MSLHLLIAIPFLGIISMICVFSIAFVIGWCLRNAMVQSVSAKDHNALYREYVALFEQHSSYIQTQEKIVTKLQTENMLLKSGNPGGPLKKVI